MSKRIEWIDRMRGLAILSVIVQHLTYNFENEFVYHKLIGISNMPVFFFISGYIIEKTARIENAADAVGFLKKKTVQLLLPLCVWQLVCNKFFFQTDWALWTLDDITGVFTHPSLWFLLTLYGYMFAFTGYRLLCKYNLMGGGEFSFLGYSPSVVDCNVDADRRIQTRHALPALFRGRCALLFIRQGNLAWQ